MKALKILLLTALAVGFLAMPGRSAVTSQTISFHSKALDRQTTYIAFLPDHYAPHGARCPVLYLLHGATGSYRDWDSKMALDKVLEPYHMIIITPDGGPFGWYLDSRIKPESQYESLLTRDLVQDVDKRFHTVPDRSGRGIAGLSMGGHGALSLAEKHPGLYSSASSMSGIVRITNHPTSWHLPDILGPLKTNRETWNANSVFELADRLTTADVTLLFECGGKDATGATKDNEQLNRKLTRLGIPHIYHQDIGGHTWDYWENHLPGQLAFHAANFEKRKNQKADSRGKSTETAKP